MDHVTEHMRQHEERGGLFPTTYDLNSGDAKGNSYSVGSLADSAYEYLIKLWLMTDRTESKYLDMCRLFSLSRYHRSPETLQTSSLPKLS